MTPAPLSSGHLRRSVAPGDRQRRRWAALGGLTLVAGSLTGVVGPTSRAGAQITPLQIASPVTKFDRVSMGARLTCAALGSGQIACAGNYTVPDGQGPSENTKRAYTSPAIDAVGVMTGGDASCVRKGSGRLNCWGFSNSTGTGSLQSVTNPNTPVGLSDVVSGDAGDDATNCVLRSNGQVNCWGIGADGQRGDGTTDTLGPLPRAVVGLNNAKQVSVGSAFGCALEADGTVKCWGSNFQASFLPPYPTSGADPTAKITTATLIPGLTGVNSISLYTEQGCALITDGTVKCWADFSTASASPPKTPTSVAGVTTGRAIATGFTHACALLSDTTVTCWGQGAKGQLGRAVSVNDWQAPTVVPSLTGVVSIHAGKESTCAVINDGSVRCWGDNTNGQLGLSGTQLNTPTVVPQFSFGGKFTPANPQRILDTRGPNKPAAGSVTTLQVRGVAGVPATANGVLLNVTVDAAEGDGYITVFPCTATPPNASNLNYVVGQTIPNLVAAPLSADGKVCLFTFAKAHLLADLEGYYDNATGSNFIGLAPSRVLDTRTGTGAPATKVGAGASIEVQVTGTTAGVPAGASGVVMNVTVDAPEGGGYVTVYPCTPTPPNASNLNYVTGLTIPNLVSVPLSASGKACFYTFAKAHLIADVAGYYGATGPAFAPVDSQRVLDTRTGVGAPVGKLGANQTLRLSVRGIAGGVPADAQTVVLNVTAVDPSADGYATVYPCSATPPNASNLNFRTGRNIPNLVMMPISATGEVCIFTSAPSHFLADINGHYRPV